MSNDLFYPEFCVQIGGYIFNRGVSIEICSDRNSCFDWAKIKFTPEFQEKVSIAQNAPGRLFLGYGGTFNNVFDGYAAQIYNSGGHMDEVLLKDKMMLLERTFITNTFLDVTPQEILSYCLSRAGITRSKLSKKVYQPRAVVPVYQKTVRAVMKEVETIWDIKSRFFFADDIFYWGVKPEQEKLYSFEYGVNILSLDKSLGMWELETVSAPFVKHSHSIRISHPKVSGTFEVEKVVFRTNESGFIRTYISF